jgi:hypothetical protein
VVDFVNRGPLFDPLYLYPPLLDAAARIVGWSFKLSSLNARTLRPGSAVLDIHVDVGFISGLLRSGSRPGMAW